MLTCLWLHHILATVCWHMHRMSHSHMCAIQHSHNIPPVHCTASSSLTHSFRQSEEAVYATQHTHGTLGLNGFTLKQSQSSTKGSPAGRGRAELTSTSVSCSLPLTSTELLLISSRACCPPYFACTKHAHLSYAYQTYYARLTCTDIATVLCLFAICVLHVTTLALSRAECGQTLIAARGHCY